MRLATPAENFKGISASSKVLKVATIIFTTARTTKTSQVSKIMPITTLSMIAATVRTFSHLTRLLLLKTSARKIMIGRSRMKKWMTWRTHGRKKALVLQAQNGLWWSKEMRWPRSLTWWAKSWCTSIFFSRYRESLTGRRWLALMLSFGPGSGRGTRRWIECGASSTWLEPSKSIMKSSGTGSRPRRRASMRLWRTHGPKLTTLISGLTITGANIGAPIMQPSTHPKPSCLARRIPKQSKPSAVLARFWTKKVVCASHAILAVLFARVWVVVWLVTQKLATTRPWQVSTSASAFQGASKEWLGRLCTSTSRIYSISLTQSTRNQLIIRCPIQTQTKWTSWSQLTSWCRPAGLATTLTVEGAWARRTELSSVTSATRATRSIQMITHAVSKRMLVSRKSTFD